MLDQPHGGNHVNVPVYLLTGEYPPSVGGIADYTARLAEALLREGVDVTVLLGQGHPLPPGEESVVSVERLTSNMNGWDLLPAVKQRLGGRAAILHIQYQTAAFGMHPAINLLPRFLSVASPQSRTIVTCHDVRVPYLFPKAGPVRTLVNHLMIDACDSAIFSDSGDREWAGGRATHTLIPIGSGVPVVSWPQEQATTRPFRVGYFGFLNSTKGLDTGLLAVQSLVAEGRDLELVFIGDALGSTDPTNAATRAAVQALINRLGLASHVHETGRMTLNEVSAALMDSDVLMFPFRDGATFRRSSIAAALAHGRPVITTLRPDGSNGIPGFENGEDVLLVPPGDPPVMAAALARLMDEPELREKLARGARQAARILDWQSIARQTIRVYEQALNGRVRVGAPV